MHELGTAAAAASVCRGIRPVFFIAPAHPVFRTIYNFFNAFGNNQGNAKKGGCWNGQ
jgi:hypothetical protein